MVNARARSRKGFTIVELIVVIVVIGILAAITIVSYRGVQQRAMNASIIAEFKSWKDAFRSYYAVFGRFPTMPADSHYCLGTGFPGGKCRDYLANNAHTYTEASSTAFMADLNQAPIRVGKTPKYPINGTVGPYVTFQQGNDFIGLTIVLYGGQNDCPADTYYIWDDGAGRLLCEWAVAINE